MTASLTDSVSWAKDTLMNVRLCKPKLFEYIQTFALPYEKEDWSTETGVHWLSQMCNEKETHLRDEVYDRLI